MTTELQRAMARYEEARARYRKAVLASLGGASNGDAIRTSIEQFQRRRAELNALSCAPGRDPAHFAPTAAAAEAAAVSGASRKTNDTSQRPSLLRRLLGAGPGKLVSREA